VPEWGGVFQYDTNKTSLTTEDLKLPFGHFIAHLRKLLGFQSGKNLKGNGVPFPEEIAALKENRIRECMHTTASTLKGLRDLVDSLPSSLQVPTRVSDLYRSSVENSATNPFLSRRMSELAFFDSELVSMLYFPAEHTYAIYLPLLLPIAVTVLGAIRAEIRIRRKKRQLQSKRKAE